MLSMEMPKNLKESRTVPEVGTAAATDRQTDSPPSKANFPDWHSGRSVFGVPMMTAGTQSGPRRGRCQCGNRLHVRRRDHCQSPGDLHGRRRVHRQTPDDLAGRHRQHCQSPNDLHGRRRDDCQSRDGQNDRHRDDCHTGNDLNGCRFHDSESINRRNINHLRDWRRFSLESHALGRRDQMGRPECSLGQSQLCVGTGRSGLCPAAGSTQPTNQKERTQERGLEPNP